MKIRILLCPQYTGIKFVQKRMIENASFLKPYFNFLELFEILFIAQIIPTFMTSHAILSQVNLSHSDWINIPTSHGWVKNCPLSSYILPEYAFR